jgi:hypothetical protein
VAEIQWQSIRSAKITKFSRMQAKSSGAAKKLGLVDENCVYLQRAASAGNVFQLRRVDVPRCSREEGLAMHGGKPASLVAPAIPQSLQRRH